MAFQLSILGHDEWKAHLIFILLRQIWDLADFQKIVRFPTLGCIRIAYTNSSTQGARAAAVCTIRFRDRFRNRSILTITISLQQETTINSIIIKTCASSFLHARHFPSAISSEEATTNPHRHREHASYLLTHTLLRRKACSKRSNDRHVCTRKGHNVRPPCCLFQHHEPDPNPVQTKPKA
jgi:hypothetical protein